jgi:hypothetical protein
MSARLRALAEGPDIVVGRSAVLVGRHPHCDVRLRSHRVSRWHCCLTEVDGCVLVRDLGSTNGTLINGRFVEAGRLRPGDELSIANLRYRLEWDRADRSSTADSRAGLSGDDAPLDDHPGTRPFGERQMGDRLDPMSLTRASGGRNGPLSSTLEGVRGKRQVQ